MLTPQQQHRWCIFFCNCRCKCINILCFVIFPLQNSRSPNSSVGRAFDCSRVFQTFVWVSKCQWFDSAFGEAIFFFGLFCIHSFILRIRIEQHNHHISYELILKRIRKAPHWDGYMVKNRQCGDSRHGTARSAVKKKDVTCIIQYGDSNIFF